MDCQTMKFLDEKYLGALATSVMHAKTLEESFSFANSFREKQIESKQWLINHLTGNPKHVCILGSWYSSVLPYLLFRRFAIIDKIDCVDNDPNVQRLAKVFRHFMGYEHRVRLWVKDAKEFITANDEYDLVINTSCEHMPFDMNEIVKKKTQYAFESNNYFGIDGHINCKKTLSEFADSTGLREISTCEERDMGHYKRFLVVGKC